MKLIIALAQFKPTLNVLENLYKMVKLITQTKENDIVVMPEGCLSGYSHNLGFLNETFALEIEQALLNLQSYTKQHHVHLIFGSCIKEEGSWYNAGIYISPNGVKHIYKKVNLAIHERGILKEGNDLSCFDLDNGEANIKVAIQLCREIRFPEQWKFLSLNGANVIFYLTNIIDTEELDIWNAHLISRAAENQRYVISSNIAHVEQGCSSMVISPKGKVIKMLEVDCESLERIQIGLSGNSNWYLSQSRKDLLDVTAVGPLSNSRQK
ncbi:carbon-nitrogen hydrolase family protein [Sutcliffiella horikoshii]|uniref:carbon-nitrogen hydrolase family protein n=1 Tax=Sutcliffiella horikoshii TaxID=79883 RepID=UPI00384CEDC0